MHYFIHPVTQLIEKLLTLEAIKKGFKKDLKTIHLLVG